MPRCGAVWIVSKEHVGLETRDTHHRVPRTSAERKSIVADAQTADTVVVTLQCTDSLTAQSIPDLAEVSIFQRLIRMTDTYLALEVIVTSEQKSTRNGECDGGDTANGLANLENKSAKLPFRRQFKKTYGVALQLSVGADVEKTARSVVGTSTKSVSVGEELDGVDVRVVSSEGLNALLLSNIPELGESIASTGNELIVVERVDAQAHNVAEVVGKFLQLLAGLNIPEHTGHVTRRCQDATVVDEATA